MHLLLRESRNYETTSARETAIGAAMASASTNLGCNSNCTFKGQTFTCEDRIRWSLLNLLSSLHDQPGNDIYARTCKLAGERVTSECSNCATCSVDAWCRKELAATPAATKATSTTINTAKAVAATGKLSCKTRCTLEGQSASCEDRMTWAMTHDPQVAMSANPCEAAGKLIRTQCAVCDACSMKQWCSEERRQAPQYAFRKFEKGVAGGLITSAGSSKVMTGWLIVACVVASTGFALVWWRSPAVWARVAFDQDSEGYADPLCSTPENQFSSRSCVKE